MVHLLLGVLVELTVQQEQVVQMEALQVHQDQVVLVVHKVLVE